MFHLTILTLRLSSCHLWYIFQLEIGCSGCVIVGNGFTGRSMESVLFEWGCQSPRSAFHDWRMLAIPQNNLSWWKAKYMMLHSNIFTCVMVYNSESLICLKVLTVPWLHDLKDLHKLQMLYLYWSLKKVRYKNTRNN